MIIKLLIDGGDMKPGPAIAQQLGPKGINMGKVISEVNAATREFKGMKVPVELDINEKTKDFEVRTSSPPTSELLKKELKLEKGTASHNTQLVGNASIEDIIKITKIKYANMLDKDFKTAVKSVLGTARAVGILVESKNPNELIVDVQEGKFDKEINEKKVETNSEKRNSLDNYFNDLKKAQEEKLASEKKALEAAEAAAAEAKPSEAVPVEVSKDKVKDSTKEPAKQPAKPLAKPVAPPKK